jgi:hypothetical protein
MFVLFYYMDIKDTTSQKTYVIICLIKSSIFRELSRKNSTQMDGKMLKHLTGKIKRYYRLICKYL